VPFFIIAFLLITAVTPSLAEDKWIRLRTNNFEVYTPQSEKKARETALYFEQLREFFLSYWRTQADPGTPVRIVLFGNEKQYEPFRPHKEAAGYFQHGMDRDWIVIGGNQQGWERIVCHEYTHLMVKQSGMNLPVWLNEGIAEIYSTFRPIGDKVRIGDIIPSHFFAVQSGWVPVPRLFEITHDDPEYNGKNTAQFYAASWGITHMLMLSQQDRKLYEPFLSKLATGATVPEALAASSLRPEKLDGDLRIYMKNNDRFYAAMIPFKSQRSDAAWTSERLAPAEVDAMLALLQSNSPRTEDAKSRLARLDPNNWHSQESLAYAAWRDHEMKAASTHFQKAIELGATSAKLYFDAARASMYSGTKNQDSITYLKKAIELYPEWTEARLQLLEQYSFLGRHAEALGVSLEFKRITPQLASRLFRGISYTEAMLDSLERATQSAKKARDSAKSDFDKAECLRLDVFLGRLESARKDAKLRAELLSQQLRETRERADQEDAAGLGNGVPAPLDENRPAIRRQTSESTSTEPIPDTQPQGPTPIVKPANGIEFTGTLTSLDCGSKFPILHLKNDKGETLQIQLLDPTKVNMQMLRPGEKMKELELNCGDQSRKVKIIYLPPTTDRKLGELRGIEYL
jgi:tetratricopeptide (TPR) repeat protein